ncbi:hypothetical protein R3P38DRAFT_2765813 [Favolaschia claudopus]|uniref:Uncharacterized protein n=1 Tax=Favolaschia claudopus TaxID=2862362 RepID=A0AAW0D9E1_9AGAR
MRQAPRYALYSGYCIPSDYFIDLAEALNPGYLRYAPSPIPPNPWFGNYIIFYRAWRRHLSEEDRDKAPLVKGDAQMQDPALCKENEIDRIKRDQFLDLIERTRKTPFTIDESRLHFECIKETNPFYYVRLPSGRVNDMAGVTGQKWREHGWSRMRITTSRIPEQPN